MLVAGVALPLAPAALRRRCDGAASSARPPAAACWSQQPLRLRRQRPMVLASSSWWERRRRVNPTSCVPANARKAFGPKFVNYLARFLLAYDSQTRGWARACARAAVQLGRRRLPRRASSSWASSRARSSSRSAIRRRRQVGRPADAKGRGARAQLLTLLRSRYGNRSDALRQLALLFSLLPPGVQPTSTIEALVAEQEDRETSGVIVIDGGSLVLSDNGLLKGLPPPALPKPAAPTSMKPSAAKAAKPFLRPTGRVLTLAVTSGGRGYDPAAPPLVSLTAPLNGGRAARARRLSARMAR